MNFTVSTISKSLADYLAPSFPGVTFYEDPNQQDSQPPMMFLQTRTNRLELETDRSLRSWLAAVARNRAVDYLRRKKESGPVPDGLPDPAPGPEEQAERRETEARLRALVEEMEEPDRTLFLRYYYQEEPLDLVCRDLKMHPSTARSRLCRGRRKLREQLDQEGGMIHAQPHP